MTRRSLSWQRLRLLEASVKLADSESTYALVEKLSRSTELELPRGLFRYACIVRLLCSEFYLATDLFRTSRKFGISVDKYIEVIILFYQYMCSERK